MDALRQDTIIVRDDADALVLVDPRRGRLTLRWRWGVPGGTYRSVLLEVAEAIATHALVSLMSDSRHMGAILHADTEWTMNELTPRLKRTPLKRVAVVNSPDFIHQMAAGRMAAEADPSVPYDVLFFDAADEAERWLKEVERS